MKKLSILAVVAIVFAVGSAFTSHSNLSFQTEYFVLDAPQSAGSFNPEASVSQYDETNPIAPGSIGTLCPDQDLNRVCAVSFDSQYGTDHVLDQEDFDNGDALDIAYAEEQ